MNQFNFKLSLITVGAMILCAPPAFTGEYRINLPYGYQLIKSNPWQHNICDANGVETVPPDIREYQVVETVILGWAMLSGNPQFQTGSQAGYFIINCLDKTAKSGMSYFEFQESCRSMGIEVPKKFQKIK